MVFIIDCMTVV